ncbi:MAG: coagulation factor 5/8 type domain protein [Pedosphaera sp.]|nr:coagulation factor 5/8 type domain protein [Pedosphaera sp.]
MKTRGKYFLKSAGRWFVPRAILIFAGVLLAEPIARGTVVTLQSSDAVGTSSITGSTNWSDKAVPSPGNDYLINGFNSRTPTSGSVTFGGNSLTLSNSATLAFKTSGTLTIGTNASTGLFMNNANLGGWNGSASTLAGLLTLQAGGGTMDPQAFSILNLTSVIGGTGALTVAGPSGQYGGTVRLLASNNYAGGTLINAVDTLQLSGPGTLGAISGALTMNVIQGVSVGKVGTLNLNGTSQNVGNLAGNAYAMILNNATGTTSMLTIGNGNGSGGNFGGAIVNGSGLIALTKVGVGIITLSGTNTYTGGTTVTGGALQMATASGQFSGGGTVVLMAATTNTARLIANASNQFTGKWVVASGWLVGATNDAFGTNDITVDPLYPLEASANGSPLAGVSVIEPRYDLNSAGKLTLTDGGKMLLHQNCAFSAVRIEGAALAAGTYSYAALMAGHPNNFPPGGAGQITVQPFGSLPNYSQLPQFTIQPQSQTNFPSSAVQFSAYAFGNPAPDYRWMAGVAGSGIYTNLIEGGQFTGSGSDTLAINNLTLANAADYVVVATNASGSVTSAPARLTIIQSAAIQTYPLPSIYSTSSVYALKVNGTNVPVVSFTGDYDYAQLSMAGGTATFEVTALTQSSIVSYGISPKKLNLTGSASGNKLTFTISANQYLILQLNGLKCLVIGADATELDVPPSSGPGIFNVTNTPYNADNTGTTKASAAIQNAINDASAYGSVNGQGIVFVPAGVYLSGNLQFKSNVALYLQGGSLIRCTGNPADYSTNQTFGPLSIGTWFLYATNGFNMKIYGRGTVDANGGYMVYTKNFAVNTLMPLNCTNFTAEGITFRDSGGWAIIPCIGADMKFNNLKIFNQLSVGNSDGIDVNCARNVTVTNCIAIGLDDPYSTKTYTSIPWPGGTMMNSNIVFDGCIAWTICYAFKVGQGVETVQDGITFKNGVAYDCAGAVCIDHKNGASIVRNVTFDTIDVERVSYVNAGHGAWGVFLVQNGLGDGGGPVSNILVKNITVRDVGTTGGFIQGLSSSASINGITFDHIYLPGSSSPASNLFQMALTNVAFYGNVTILPVQTSEPLLVSAKPALQSAYLQQPVRFTASAWGNLPLSYQWQVKSNGVFVNLSDGGQISASQTATLQIANITYADATNYLVRVSDNDNSPVSSAPVSLTVIPPLGPPINATMSDVEPNTSPATDWNTAGYWSNGLSASNTAMAYPGSTFEILPGGGMRTPYNVASASFPGIALTVDGNGIWNDAANIGQIILKNSGGGSVNWPNLVMQGGQISSYVDFAGSSQIVGVMNIQANTPIGANQTGSGGAIDIAAQLTGSGGIEYHAYSGSTFQPTWIGDLNVSGNHNSFSGTWNVVIGTLLANGAGALGTNTITVGPAGALQANYSLDNPAGDLILNGRLNLTQAHRFHSVTVNGATLVSGQYSFAQLNAVYPANFPANWVAQPGAPTTNAAGSLIVGLPLTLNIARNGTQLLLTWAGSGKLLEATNLLGPWSTNAAAQSPFPITPSEPQKFYQVK